MESPQQQLEAAIAALEARRELLGDAVVEALLGPARARLAQLAALPAPEPDAAQALRQVSILFLDVVGSTTLSRTLDPEAISAVMDDALARGTAIVQTHRGRVLQYAGDNILAAFGADEAREDDAERAVRCGLALLRLGRTLGAEVLRLHGHAGFDFRVGIHTGGVLLGGGVADGSIRGMAVNIAARMEQTSPPGALRISHDTFNLVRGLFEVQPQPPLQVKGLEEPVRSYLVDRPAARAFRAGTRGIDGLGTRMVGRDGELARLQAAFDQVCRERQLALVTVVADAGIGKSRLLQEFERAVGLERAEVPVLRCRCTPASPMQPYGALRELFAGAWGLRDDDTLPQAQARVAAAVVPLFEADDGVDAATAHAHLLGHLLGIDHGTSPHVAGIRSDVSQVRARAWHAALQWFRRSAARQERPWLLMLEDLHWADDSSLDFLAELARRSADVPLLLLATARPALDERRAGWPGDGVARHQRVAFGPLDTSASQALLDELLKRLPEVPAALREQLLRHAEGNPFYLEELVRMLVDQGAIRVDPDSGAWSIDAERLRLAHVPATLTGVLQARLDSLQASERLALQQASVIGSLFWAEALAVLDAQAVDELPQLVRKALTVPRGEDDDGLREYAFGHQLLHQVTYGTVLQRFKRELHGKVAAWLAALTGARAADFLALIAEHYERAGEVTQALRFHIRAAEHARDRYAHDTVLRHAEQALALLDQAAVDDAAVLRWDLHFLRLRSHGYQGRRAQESQALDDLDAASAAVDDGRRAYARLLRAEACPRRGDAVTMEQLAEEGRVLAERAGHVQHALRALFLKSSARLMVGDLAGCAAMAREGLAAARQHGLPLLVAGFVNELAIVSFREGDLPQSLALAQEAREATRAIGDRRNEAGMLVNIGAFHHQLGQPEAAWNDLEQALKVARAAGSAIHVAAVQVEQAAVALSRGDTDAARALALAAHDSAAAAGERLQQVAARAVLGDVELAAGRLPAAEAAYAEALGHAAAFRAAEQHRARAGLAEVALARGDLAAATAAVQELGTPDADTLEASGAARRIEWICHRVHAAAGEAEPAGRWLQRAHDGLMAQAARIPDPAMARDFVERVPVNAAVAAAWRAWSTGGIAPP